MEQATAPPRDAMPGSLFIPVDGITDRQARGADCVWCRIPLTVGGAIDVGQRTVDGVRQFPRGCLPCVGHYAFEALLEHVGDCPPCHVSAVDCAEGLALQRLIKRGRASEWTARQS